MTQSMALKLVSVNKFLFNACPSSCFCFNEASSLMKVIYSDLRCGTESPHIFKRGIRRHFASGGNDTTIRSRF